MTELQTIQCARCQLPFAVRLIGRPPRYCVPCDAVVAKLKARAANIRHARPGPKIGPCVVSPNGIRGTIMGDHRKEEVTVHMENGEYAKLRCEAR